MLITVIRFPKAWLDADWFTYFAHKGDFVNIASFL